MAIRSNRPLLDAPVNCLSNTLPRLVADRARAVAFRTFGAPTLHQRLQIPRKPLFIATGEQVVQVGTPNPERVHQLRSYVGEAGRVLIIEPLPENCERLAAAAAEYANVTVDHRAAGPESGSVEMAVVDAGTSSQVASDAGRMDVPQTDTATVDVARLDTILAEHGVAPDHVEVMVNGAEAAVLVGASEMLSGAGPRLLVKSYGFERGGVDPSGESVALLERAGYEIVRAPSRREPPSKGSPDGDVFAYK